MELYYEWELRQRAKKPACTCRECGGMLYPGEVYYDICGQAVCRDCLPQLARKLFRNCRRVAAGKEEKQ